MSIVDVSHAHCFPIIVKDLLTMSTSMSQWFHRQRLARLPCIAKSRESQVQFPIVGLNHYTVRAVVIKEAALFLEGRRFESTSHWCTGQGAHCSAQLRSGDNNSLSLSLSAPPCQQCHHLVLTAQWFDAKQTTVHSTLCLSAQELGANVSLTIVLGLCS